MANNNQRILKYLGKNSDRGPTITDMMIQLKIGIPDLVTSLESMLSQGSVEKRVNESGIESWYPATSAVSKQPISTPPQNPSPALTPESEPMPPTVDLGLAAPSYVPPMPMYPNMNPNPSGVGTMTFVVGLFLTGVVSAWIGGHYLAGKTLKAGISDLAKQKSLDEAVVTWTDLGSELLSQTKALEAKVQSLSATLDSIKGLQLKDTVIAKEKAVPPKAAVKSKRRGR